MVVSRVYLYNPALVKAIFTLGTPYLPPNPNWLDFDELIKEKPTFEYQRYFGSSEFENYLRSDKEIREFFNATFGGVWSKWRIGVLHERALSGELESSPKRDSVEPKGSNND